jgi:two-component system sensor histidine kinase MprB
MTLAGRITLATGVAVLVSVVAASWTVYGLEVRDLRRDVDRDLTRQAAAVGAALLTTGDVDEILRGGPLRTAGTYAQFVGSDGEVVPLTTTRPMLPVEERTRRLAHGEGDRFFADVEVEGSHVRVLSVPTPDGVVQVARTVDDVDLHLWQVLGVVLAIAGAGVLVALAIGRLVARMSLRPVRQLVVEAEAMATTRTFERRLDASGSDELARLAASLNALLDALAESLHRQRQLVADASHELKTPLTGLRTELELLHLREDFPEADRALSAVGDLASAVDDLVELARDRAPDWERDDVALDALVRDCVRWVRRHHRDALIRVRLEPLRVRANRSQVARAVANLLDNALKHTPSGTAVEVSLRGGVLEVRDHGPGIPEPALPFVFERFYRAEGARAVPGAGLGLAIVRKVAVEHGWEVQAENAPGGGALFTIRTGASATTSDTLRSGSRDSHPGPVHRSPTISRGESW